MLDLLKLGNLFGALMNLFCKESEDGLFARLFKLLLAIDITL